MGHGVIPSKLGDCIYLTYRVIDVSSRLINSYNLIRVKVCMRKAEIMISDY